MSPPTSLVGDARFGGRALAFAAYTLGTLGKFELEARGFDEARTEALIASTMHRYGRHMCRLYGIDVAVRGFGGGDFALGRDAQGLGRIFVANHRSGLDILVTLAHVEGKHVSRADLAGWPVIGVIARRAGILFVDRESRRSAAAVVQQMITTVQRGVGVIIFPEGTTYAGDEVRPFKPGAFAVARRTGCDIVPLGVAYGGEGATYADESFLEHMRRVSSARRTQVGLVMGEPMRATLGVDNNTLAEEARCRVQALVGQARSLVGG